MALDRPVADKERGGDLTVGQPFRDERRDATLGRRKRVRRKRPTADSAQLHASLFRPERGAQVLEDTQGGAERLPRRAQLLRAPLRGSLRKQRARKLERVFGSGVLHERLVEQIVGTAEVARGRMKQRTTTGGDRQRPGPIERVAPALQPGGLSLGLLQLAGCHERVEQSGRLPLLSRLAVPDRFAEVARLPERRQGIAGTAEGELDEAEHPSVSGTGCANAGGLGPRERVLRGLACLVYETAMSSDQRARPLVHRSPPRSPGLFCQRDRLIGQ